MSSCRMEREGGQGQVRSPNLLAVIPSLPGLNFSNCSRQALEKALLGGMGSCPFERLSGLPSMASVCGNMLVEPSASSVTVASQV